MIMDKQVGVSRLFNYTAIDPREEIDEKLEQCYKFVQSITNGLGEQDANAALQQQGFKSDLHYLDIQQGLFLSILIDPKSASKSYRDLTLVNKDQFTKVIQLTITLIHEKWSKLHDTPRQQLIWLIKEFVRHSVHGAETIIQTILRRITGGDVSRNNVWLAEAILDILIENRAWLLELPPPQNLPPLVTIVIYTYLRIIVDHNAAKFAPLRNKEVDFVIGLLREKWLECMGIGRDLVRILQDVARIPAFGTLWKEILHTPSALEPSFKGIQQLMCMKTHRRYLVTRLLPEMENDIHFLTSKVQFGNHKRYQDWFQTKYLSTPESQSLRCDLIRFICSVIHPPNDILSSNVFPRWALIGWLLTTCTTNVVASNAKLALFYDWMFFCPETDSIMDIEPCILVMFFSIKTHPAITATLIDFMCRITTNFYPPLASKVKEGISNSLRTIVDKGVLKSLDVLFDARRLDRELRAILREHFPDFCKEVKDDPNMRSALDGVTFSMADQEEAENRMHINMAGEGDNSNPMDHLAEFSDDDDEPSPAQLAKSSSLIGSDDNRFIPIPEEKFIPVDLSKFMDKLQGRIRELVIALQNESVKLTQCEQMDQLMQLITSAEEFENLAAPLAMCLNQILAEHFRQKLYPQVPDDDALEESIAKPLFVIFRHICQMGEEDPNRGSLMLLLEEMYTKQRRIGFNFLYFLKVSKNQTEGKMAPYKDFCKGMEKDLKECLMADLEMCAEEDILLFTFLIPDIYTQFNSLATGHTELLHLIVSNIDYSNLQELSCEILRGHVIMFKRESLLKQLDASLEWETIEQCFLWQIIAAHSIPVEHILPLLPKLDFSDHPEALTSIMIQLKQELPCLELLRPLLCREYKKRDYFVVSILKYWAQESEDILAEILNKLLTNPSSKSTPSKKRSRSSNKKDKDNPSVDQVLQHLEHMRQTCQNISFLNHATMQQALQKVQLAESQKHKYSDILALAEDFEDMQGPRQPKRTLRNVASRRAAAATTSTPSSSTSSSAQGTTNNNRSGSSNSKRIDGGSESEQTESSGEEEDVRPRPSKRPKKAVVDDDD